MQCEIFETAKKENENLSKTLCINDQGKLTFDNQYLKEYECFLPILNAIFDKNLQAGNVKIDLDLDFNESFNNQFNKIDYIHYKLSSLDPIYNKILECFYGISDKNIDYFKIYKYYLTSESNNNSRINDIKNDNNYFYDKTLDEVILKITIYLNYNKVNDLLKILFKKNFFLL